MRKCIRCFEDFDDGGGRYCPICRDLVVAKEIEVQAKIEAKKQTGLITEEGQLYIKRGSEMKQMTCKTTNSSGCEDSCPHFRFPITDNDGGATIEICHGSILQFDTFVDDRV